MSQQAAMIDEAASMIDGVRGKYKEWQDVRLHANALQGSGQLLADVLAAPEAAASVKTYEDASQRAQEAQKRQRWFGTYAAWFSFAATGVSGLMLFMHLVQGTVLSLVLQAVHFLCLCLALGLAFYLKWRKPGGAWAKARLEAEGARLKHFQSILDAARHQPAPRPGQLPANLLALEYVRAHLIEDQRDWHRDRSGDFAWLARGMSTLRWLGVIFLLLAMTPVISNIVTEALASKFPEIGQWAMQARLWIGPERAALSGVFGGALQTLATNLSALSLAERNRRSFQRITIVLNSYLGEPLLLAREAAASEKDLIVERFWSSVRTELACENSAWHEALGVSSTNLLEQLPRSAGRH